MIQPAEIADTPQRYYTVEPRVRPPQPTEPALCWCCGQNPPTWGWHWIGAYGWFYSACSKCQSEGAT
jgi:hypothetical protein